eukprot:469132_1
MSRLCVKQLIEYAVTGFIRSRCDTDYVLFELATLCMKFVSNNFTKSQYIYIERNEETTEYKTKLFGMKDVPKDVKEFTMQDFFDEISLNHNIASSQLIGIVWHHKRGPSLCYENTNVMYNNSINNFVHKYDNEVDESDNFPIFVYHIHHMNDTLRYLLVVLMSLDGIIGYPLLLKTDSSKMQWNSAELYKNVFNLISKFIKQTDKIKADAKLLVQCYVKNNGDDEMEIKENDNDTTINLNDILSINVSLFNWKTKDYMLSNWSVRNCDYDVITAPIREYISVSYVLLKDGERKMDVDDKKEIFIENIDSEMNNQEFKIHLINKHPKWFEDKRFDDINLQRIPRNSFIKDYKYNYPHQPIFVSFYPSLYETGCLVM